MKEERSINYIPKAALRYLITDAEKAKLKLQIWSSDKITGAQKNLVCVVKVCHPPSYVGKLNI